jgi:peroxiredoxin
MRKLFSSVLAVALASISVVAGEETPPPEVGLCVGARAPGFTLKDQNNHDVSLDTLLKKGPVALVFYRSADWCLFCKFQLQHLQRNLKRFEATGGQVVGISYDAVPALKKFADSRGISLPMLSDPGSKTIDAYAMRDRVSAGPTDGFAAHGVFVLDQQGIIRTKLLTVIYQEQPGVDYLLKALEAARIPDNTAKKPAQNVLPVDHHLEKNHSET